MLTDDELPPLPELPEVMCLHAGSIYDSINMRDHAIAYGQACQAATLATVTPLVRDMVEAMIATYPDLNGLAVMSNEALERVNKHANAITAARAFLSGATKESTDHG